MCYRAVTETVHHTAGHLVSQQPPASNGHRQVDTAQDYKQDGGYGGGDGGGDGGGNDGGDVGGGGDVEVKNLLIME